MVTISREAGVGGEEIARILAKELKWKFLDREALEQLLAERGFSRVEFEIYDEKKPGLWHRFCPPGRLRDSGQGWTATI